MNAEEFVKGKDFTSSKGLPVGKTVINLETADFKQTSFPEEDGTAKIVNQVTLDDQTFNLPKTVMQKVQEAVEKNAKGLEINRSGTTRNDTKYVVYLLDADGQPLKE